MKRLIGFCFFSILLLSSCFLIKKTAKQKDGDNELLDTIVVKASKEKPVYRAKHTKTWEISHTRIALNFNFNDKTAEAREWIQVHPYFYASDSIELDAKGMKIDSVQIILNNSYLPLKYSYAKDILKIYFDHFIHSGEKVSLYFKYTSLPYTKQTGGSDAITSDRGLYFINTDGKIPNKPAQIWTQGETEANSHWLITIDKPNCRFTTQVELTVPDSMTTLSNGLLADQKKEAKHLRTDIWKMDMPIQAYVVMFAIGKFSTIRNEWQGKEVNYLVEPEYEPYAKNMFANTCEMLTFFSKKTGVPYPWPKYSQVVVRDYVSGAMENTSAALFGEFMNQTPREIVDYGKEDVVAHELFHEWFGDYVTCASWSNLTLNESFANYGEQLWHRYKYGKVSGDIHAYNNLNSYLNFSKRSDPPLVRYKYETQDDMFDGISYSKGSAILRYINSIIGEEAFDKAMKLYLTRNALHDADVHDWKKAIEEVTGQDWGVFFDQWYFHGGHPVLDVDYYYDFSKMEAFAVVRQSSSDSGFFYDLTLKSACLFADTSYTFNHKIGKKLDTFWMGYRNAQLPAFILDYEHVLPGVINDNKTMEHWYCEFVGCNDFANKKEVLKAIEKSVDDTFAQKIVALALQDKLPGIRTHALQICRFDKTDSLKLKLTEKVRMLGKNDSSNAVRAAAIMLLGYWNDSLSYPFITQAVEDSSYLVGSSALFCLNGFDSAAALKKSYSLVADNPSGGMVNTVWSIIGNNVADSNIQFFEKYKYQYSDLSRKYALLGSLYAYCKIVHSDSVFARSINIYETLVSEFSNKNVRSSFSFYLFNLTDDLDDKSRMKSKEKEASFTFRREVIKNAIQKLIEIEPEETEKANLLKKWKEYFES